MHELVSCFKILYERTGRFEYVLLIVQEAGMILMNEDFGFTVNEVYYKRIIPQSYLSIHLTLP